MVMNKLFFKSLLINKLVNRKLIIFELLLSFGYFILHILWIKVLNKLFVINTCKKFDMNFSAIFIINKTVYLDELREKYKKYVN